MLTSFEELVGINFCCRKATKDTEALPLLDSLYFTYGVTLSIVGGFSIPSMRDEMICLFQKLAKHYQHTLGGSSGLSAYAAVLFCFVHGNEDKYALFQQKNSSSGNGSGPTLTRSASGIINKYNVAVNLSNEGPIVACSGLIPDIHHLGLSPDIYQDQVGNDAENSMLAYRASFFTHEVFPDDSVAVLYTAILLVMLDKIEVNLYSYYYIYIIIVSILLLIMCLYFYYNI